MICGNCRDAETTGSDYLCVHCRRAVDNDTDWQERKRCQLAVAEYVNTRDKMFYGVEIFFPEDSPWAWFRVLDEPSLSDPEAITGRPLGEWMSSGALVREYEKRVKVPLMVVWKHTGHIYEIGPDGAVEDDPIFAWEGD